MTFVNSLFAVGWLVFWVYWFVGAATAKKNVTQRMNRFVAVRLGIFVLVLALVNIPGFRQEFSISHRLAHGNPALLVVGSILFLLGLLFAVWARWHLGNNWGMPMTLKQDPELITSGPYKYVRHPIYSGLLLAILGTALSIGLYWFIVLVATAVYFIFSAVIEEKNMAKQFPKEYPSYKKKTKLLIPFVL